jgi:galactokinase
MRRVDVDDLRRDFAARFGAAPLLVRAAGRVNLIGEHTDYNDGLVMPAAIDRYTWVAAAARSDRTLCVASRNLPGEARSDLQRPQPRGRGHWSDYAIGVAVQLERHGVRLRGADLLVDSDVPLGAGLSSSAALEVAVARALLAVAGASVAPLQLARLCQAAEHEFAGTHCGIMDQYTACFGGEGLLLLDCRALRHRLVPLPADVRLLVCNSMVRHSLAAGEYNRRRADCAAALEILRARQPQIAALRDLHSADLVTFAERLGPRLLPRVRHVVSENERVIAAAAALERGDVQECGGLLYASHASLRDDYQVSCSELDALVDAARPIPGIYGARMTGGGFGGCTVNLVAADAAEAAGATLVARYAQSTGRRAEAYVCSLAAP